jgi:hypothetical protein
VHWFNPGVGEVSRVKESIGANITRMRENVVDGHEHPLLELLEATRESRCCDPKDRVFALLGLASDVEEESIVVDYMKSRSEVRADALNFFKSKPQRMGRHGRDYISSLLTGMLYGG